MLDYALCLREKWLYMSNMDREPEDPKTHAPRGTPPHLGDIEILSKEQLPGPSGHSYQFVAVSG